MTDTLGVDNALKVVGNLERDQEKLKDGSITGLTDIVRWTDKLLVEPLP